MKYISILLAILLFIAAANMPPGYYQFLRLAICAGGIFVLVTDKKGILFYQLLVAILVILFNPVFPIYLYKKSIWMPIDITGGLVFLLNVLHRKHTTGEGNGHS